MATVEAKLGWRFPRTFWTANIVELFERAAYYGCFIALALYLTDRVGFTDIETGWIVAVFASVMYFLPTFTGAAADRMGFRAALALAFSLLTLGYSLLGASQQKGMALLSLALILVGGAIVKPVISGTVAKCSDDAHRARAFSIFYQIVNIGAFLGKTVAKPLRTELGLEYINFYAASMAAVALVVVLLFYRNVEAQAVQRSVGDVLKGLWRVVQNIRFMALIIIVGGFWAIQGQLYATMPKYTIRLIGPDASPEWLANINPFIVVLCVVPITHLVRRMRPVNSIAISLAIIPFSALAISLSPVLERWLGPSIHIVGGIAAHPITIMMIIGIALQGLAECFLSPRFLEYASKQAPEGETGLYMGYSFLTSFFAWLFGFVLSGYLLDAYCPDPKTLAPGMMQAAYANAHYIWYYFAGIGVTAFFMLLIYRFVTDRIDRAHHVVEPPPAEEPVPFIEEE
ncbi:MAG TPA: MFS transporter [bacterium]|nr:MFS transporter [bacterium]